MKTPWVSRDAYERVVADVAEWRRFSARLASDIDAERARYAHLLDQFTALRVAGAVIEPKVAERAPIAPLEPDDLQTLIAERSGSNLKVRAMMLRQLAADRAAKVPEADIRAAIEQGIQSNGVPA